MRALAGPVGLLGQLHLDDGLAILIVPSVKLSLIDKLDFLRATLCCYDCFHVELLVTASDISYTAGMHLG